MEMSPEADAPQVLPVATVTLPVAVVPVPVDNIMTPEANPPLATPEAITTLPLPLALVVPLLNTRAPELPEVDTRPDWIMTAPAVLPFPDAISTLPPVVAVVLMVSPA